MRAELEAKVGIEPIEKLLARRTKLVQQAAEVRALHGPGGTWNDKRKIELSTIRMLIRAKAVAENVKLTEAAIDETAHANERYIVFVTTGTTEKARLTILEDQIQGLTELIMRDQALTRFAASELHLA